MIFEVVLYHNRRHPRAGGYREGVRMIDKRMIDKRKKEMAMRGNVSGNRGRNRQPSAEDTWKTAIRIETATKPTTMAIETIRIGSSAFVKVTMLRSMSFW